MVNKFFPTAIGAEISILIQYEGQSKLEAFASIPTWEEPARTDQYRLLKFTRALSLHDNKFWRSSTRRPLKNSLDILKCNLWHLNQRNVTNWPFAAHIFDQNLILRQERDSRPQQIFARIFCFLVCLYARRIACAVPRGNKWDFIVFASRIACAVRHFDLKKQSNRWWRNRVRNCRAGAETVTVRKIQPIRVFGWSWLC